MADIMRWFDEIEFEYLERGGYGEGSLSMLATWEELSLTGNERVDVYILGELAYRGYVRVNEKSMADSERCKITLNGLIEQLGQWQVKRRYAYGCAPDISQVFSDIAGDYVAVTGRMPAIVIDAEDIGLELSKFDSNGKSVAQAFNSLCDLAPGQAIWGVDTDPSGNDRIYIRPRTLERTYTFVVGKNVSAFTYPRDTSAIVNRILLTGGAVEQPNLIFNGDFSDVLPSSAEVNNLLIEPSFEDNTAGKWVLGGGAAIKTAGANATCRGAARTGQKWLELDQNGETAKQTIKIDYATQYQFGMWVRYEDSVLSAGRQVKVSLEGLDVSNSTVTSATILDYFDPGSDVYSLHTAVFDFIGFPTVTQVRITIQTNAGTASNDGIIVDDVGVWVYCSAGQNGWRMNLDGAATVDTLDLMVTSPAPKSGGYCVKLKPADIALSSDVLELYQPKANRVSVKPNERYTMGVWIQTNSLGSASFSFGVAGYKSDGTLGNIINSAGTSATTVEYATTALNTSDWTLFTLPIITGSDTAQLQPFLRGRSNAVVYFSAAFVVEGECPTDFTTHGDYWPGDVYTAIFDVEDIDVGGPTTYGSDNFPVARADLDLEPGWSKNGASATTMVVNTLSGSAPEFCAQGPGRDGFTAMYYRDDITIPTNEYVVRGTFRIFLNAHGGGSMKVGIGGRLSTSAITGYVLYYDDGGSTPGLEWSLSRFVAGAETVLATYAATYAATATVVAELVIGEPAGGVTHISVYLDGVLVMDYYEFDVITSIGVAGLYEKNSGTPGVGITEFAVLSRRATDNEPISDCSIDASITTWGEHEQPVSNEQVVNHDLAVAFAKSYFAANACPKVQASLTIHGPTALMRQEGAVKLVNLVDAPDPLFPSRVRYRLNGADGLVMTAELGNEMPESADWLGAQNIRTIQGLL